MPFCIRFIFLVYQKWVENSFNIKATNVVILIGLNLFFNNLYTQSNTIVSNKIDTLKKKDSFREILVDSFTLKDAGGDIKSKIVYEAEDSIVFDNVSKKMLLYKKSKIDYNQMNVRAYYIEYDWNSSLMSAKPKFHEDSVEDKPFMKQDGKEYLTDKVVYNFKSQQGKVYNIITQEGEGILHGKEVKKDSSKNWYVRNAKYTTCDLEEPHFHFDIKKLKLIPDKAMISGPANLQVNSIPTPFTLPFGIFPLQKGRRSGLLLPAEYGFAPVFNINGLGYYWGINDYADLTLKSQIFFNGSYGFNANMRYVSTYLYNGSLSFGMNRIFRGDDDDPRVRANTPTDFNFQWVHQQSPKAHPTFSFNSSLNYQTQGFLQNPTNTTERRINAQIASNISIAKRFRNLPIELRSSVNYNQNLADKSVRGQFPNLQFNYFGNPFKNVKNASYLNQLSVVVSSEFNNQFSTYDSLLLSQRFFDELKYGMMHRVTFNFGAVKILKYFNLSPSFNYQERHYFNRTIKELDANNQIVDVKENGFFGVRDFNGGLNLSTVIYGLKQFKGKGLLGLRHQMTPNVSFSMAPNFSNDFWGYYRTIEVGGVATRYSPYSNNIYGVPSGQGSAVLNFGLSNALEGKFYNKKDTLQKFKKIPLIDVLSINTSYVLSADSFKMTDIRIGMTNTISNFLNFRLDLNYTPYVYENGRRVDKYLISSGKGLMQLMNSNAALNFNLSNSNLRKNVLKSTKGSDFERQYIFQNYHYFYDFNNPWNLAASINFSSNNDFFRDTTFYTANLSINNLDFSVTKNWKIGIQTGYDLNLKEVTRTTISAVRDMHCWEFRFSYTPILRDFSGRNTPAYNIEIRPKSSLLQDLKLMRNRPPLDAYF